MKRFTIQMDWTVVIDAEDEAKAKQIAWEQLEETLGNSHPEDIFEIDEVEDIDEEEAKDN